MVIFLIGLLLPGQSVHAAGFTINSANTSLQNKVFTFNADIDIQFSNKVLAALENGIPLFIVMEIEVHKERWWWDKKIAALEQDYMLIYHALTQKYVLNNLNSGNQMNFSSLYSAITALGKVRNLPLIDQKLLDPDANHMVRLRVTLDLESLPGPIRPLAYLSSDWRLESDWYIWSLTP